MRSEKITIELPPAYRTLLDMTRTLIHLVRPDLGPPTQSQCFQFLLQSFPVEQLLRQALADREKHLNERVRNEPGEPAVPKAIEHDAGGIWGAAVRELESAQPAKGQAKRRRSRGD